MIRAERINVGILAPVDAGKTTLAEAILFKTDKIRSAGRVDHKDAYLDTEEMEKARGITIFSKMAQVRIQDTDYTLVDTPGHVDFSAEAERTLQVLDYALLLVSAADGISGHVRTLWRLLRSYQVPVILFINKMDQPGADKEALMALLKKELSDKCLDFTAPLDDAQLQEEAALMEEELLEKLLGGEELTVDDYRRLVAERKCYPCFFGSALKMEGVEELLDGVHALTERKMYPEHFGAQVYKIARDKNGARLTYMKITGGSVKGRQLLDGVCAQNAAASAGADEEDENAIGSDEQQTWSEKVDQIRLYSGSSFEALQEASAGTICAVTGLTKTFAGENLGAAMGQTTPLLEPVLGYALILPDETDVHHAYMRLRELEEEIPELNMVWDARNKQIDVQVMGEVQTEILKSIIKERFDLDVHFGTGKIVYKETIASEVEGAGHFEPLRHYAEVHLKLEPGERGSGLTFESDCSTDMLALNWQRLVLTHLEERQHKGVLTGSPITDMKITLISGRAHIKHTEGGDFRQATYRAVRQGLMKAENVLLEPVYDFRLEIPDSQIGRAMTDIDRMHGRVQAPEIENGMAVLTGKCPVVTMRAYQSEVTAYTRGLGRLTCLFGGYLPCHNSEEVISEIGYDPEADIRHTPDSVFCSHGAGMIIPWNIVDEYMHVEGEEEEYIVPEVEERPVYRGFHADIQDDSELMEIFQRTYKSSGQERSNWKRSKKVFGESASVPSRPRPVKTKDKFLLVDGYNIIFSWEELSSLAKIDIEAARGKLLDILANYQGYRRMTLIVVFDAYKVEGGVGEVMKYHNIYVVFTKEKETADAYIEKTVHRIGHQNDVTVATSDGAEQVIILGQGAKRMSAKDLEKEVRDTCREISGQYLKEHPGAKNYLFDNISEDLAAFLNEVRMGRKKFEV